MSVEERCVVRVTGKSVYRRDDRCRDRCSTEDEPTGFVEYAELKSLAKTLAGSLSDTKRAEELDALIRGVQPLHEALEKLHEYLQDKNFKEYLMRVRESTLLGIGTEILRKISRGRYAFGHGFQIVDRQSGAMRSPRSLSGGETFLASLALSLALVEVASRGGGVLEALFLDEGFSGLDQGLSDDAFVELAQRASSGKLIGVITHLSGIAEHIDTIIRVTAEPNGSTIQLLQGTELATYMDDEVENELLPAMVTA